MPYSIEKTIRLHSRFGGMSVLADGSLIVSWDLLDEIGNSVESRSHTVPASDVPSDLTMGQLAEWADGKIVTAEGAQQAAEAAAIAAQGAK